MAERRKYLRFPLMGAAMATLLAALWAGLVRLGWAVPAIQPTLPLAHGPLMVSGFLGTLIGLERAVALGNRSAYAAPLLSGLGALALIFGFASELGAFLIVLGSLGLLWNFVAIIRRQTELFTVTMGLGALAWFVGNTLWLAAIPVPDMFAWWAAFLVLTIAGERLELTRMAPPAPRSRHLFLFCLGLYLAGLLTTVERPASGIRVAGLGMIALGLWLGRYDIARRTITQPGLTRFIAVNLLAGYFWLGLSGLLWVVFGDSLTLLNYDAMLHSLLLGFVFSMIFAHAPIIFPAVLGRPLGFSAAFYAHVVLLHVTLALRVGGDLLGSVSAYQWGGTLNLLTLLVFVANTMRAVILGASRMGVSRSAEQTGTIGTPDALRA